MRLIILSYFVLLVGCNWHSEDAILIKNVKALIARDPAESRQVQGYLAQFSACKYYPKMPEYAKDLQPEKVRCEEIIGPSTYDFGRGEYAQLHTSGCAAMMDALVITKKNADWYVKKKWAVEQCCKDGDKVRCEDVERMATK